MMQFEILIVDTLLIVFMDQCIIHKKLYYGILILDLIFFVMQGFAFKKWLYFPVYTVFTSMVSLLTLYSILSLVAAWH